MQNVLINLGIYFPSIFSTGCVVAFLLATRFRCPGTSLSVASVKLPGALVKMSNLQQCFFYFFLFSEQHQLPPWCPPMFSILFNAWLILDLSTTMFTCARDFSKSSAASSGFFFTSRPCCRLYRMSRSPSSHTCVCECSLHTAEGLQPQEGL